MDRCKDYFGFAIWFAGIGYAVLWLFSTNGGSGYPFGASMICEPSGGGALALLCDLPHPIVLPVGLHVLGIAAAAVVVARVVLRMLDRWRHRPGVMTAEAANVRLPGAIPARALRIRGRRLRKVKPRKHFGLRGLAR